MCAHDGPHVRVLVRVCAGWPTSLAHRNQATDACLLWGCAVMGLLQLLRAQVRRWRSCCGSRWRRGGRARVVQVGERDGGRWLRKSTPGFFPIGSGGRRKCWLLAACMLTLSCASLVAMCLPGGHVPAWWPCACLVAMRLVAMR